VGGGGEGQASASEILVPTSCPTDSSNQICVGSLCASATAGADLDFFGIDSHAGLGDQGPVEQRGIGGRRAGFVVEEIDERGFLVQEEKNHLGYRMTAKVTVGPSTHGDTV
jgi:hypothetical protein